MTAVWRDWAWKRRITGGWKLRWFCVSDSELSWFRYSAASCNSPQVGFQLLGNLAVSDVAQLQWTQSSKGLGFDVWNSGGRRLTVVPLNPLASQSLAAVLSLCCRRYKARGRDNKDEVLVHLPLGAGLVSLRHDASLGLDVDAASVIGAVLQSLSAPSEGDASSGSAHHSGLIASMVWLNEASVGRGDDERPGPLSVWASQSFNMRALGSARVSLVPIATTSSCSTALLSASAVIRTDTVVEDLACQLSCCPFRTAPSGEESSSGSSMFSAAVHAHLMLVPDSWIPPVSCRISRIVSTSDCYGDPCTAFVVRVSAGALTWELPKRQKDFLLLQATALYPGYCVRAAESSNSTRSPALLLDLVSSSPFKLVKPEYFKLLREASRIALSSPSAFISPISSVLRRAARSRKFVYRLGQYWPWSRRSSSAGARPTPPAEPVARHQVLSRVFGRTGTATLDHGDAAGRIYKNGDDASGSEDTTRGRRLHGGLRREWDSTETRHVTQTKASEARHGKAAGDTESGFGPGVAAVVDASVSDVGAGIGLRPVRPAVRTSSKPLRGAATVTAVAAADSRHAPRPSSLARSSSFGPSLEALSFARSRLPLQTVQSLGTISATGPRPGNSAEAEPVPAAEEPRAGRSHAGLRRHASMTREEAEATALAAAAAASEESAPVIGAIGLRAAAPMTRRRGRSVASSHSAAGRGLEDEIASSVPLGGTVHGAAPRKLRGDSSGGGSRISSEHSAELLHPLSAESDATTLDDLRVRTSRRRRRRHVFQSSIGSSAEAGSIATEQQLLATEPRGASVWSPDSFDEARVLKFDRFLQQLIAVPQLWGSPDVLEWLGALRKDGHTQRPLPLPSRDGGGSTSNASLPRAPVSTTTVVHLASITAFVRPGDIVLMTCANGPATLQRGVTACEFDHVGIIVDAGWRDRVAADGRERADLEALRLLNERRTAVALPSAYRSSVPVARFFGLNGAAAVPANEHTPHEADLSPAAPKLHSTFFKALALERLSSADAFGFRSSSPMLTAMAAPADSSVGGSAGVSPGHAYTLQLLESNSEGVRAYPLTQRLAAYGNEYTRKLCIRRLLLPFEEVLSPDMPLETTLGGFRPCSAACVMYSRRPQEVVRPRAEAVVRWRPTAASTATSAGLGRLALASPPVLQATTGNTQPEAASGATGSAPAVPLPARPGPAGLATDLPAAPLTTCPCAAAAAWRAALERRLGLFFGDVVTKPYSLGAGKVLRIPAHWTAVGVAGRVSSPVTAASWPSVEASLLSPGVDAALKASTPIQPNYYCSELLAASYMRMGLLPPEAPKPAAPGLARGPPSLSSALHRRSRGSSEHFFLLDDDAASEGTTRSASTSALDGSVVLRSLWARPGPPAASFWPNAWCSGSIVDALLPLGCSLEPPVLVDTRSMLPLQAAAVGSAATTQGD